MNNKKSKFMAFVLSASMCLGMTPFTASAKENSLSLTDVSDSKGGITISSDKISSNNFKDTKYNNPVSSDFFCADPTSVEYNGRLYLFGTNDHEQFEIAGSEVDNTYEKIKSLVVLSTDDMVNWIYHGEINVGEVAPWIMNSWAPSVASRVEEDGKTHFYLYFSNNGTGVGVIHATDPLGPWDDPLGRPLITSSTPGLKDCPNPFDPGVVIDDNGTGWLAFGGGKASGGTDYMPGSSRIVQLGDDMISFASEFSEIPAPYFFEASELNYINGTYVYTYCSDWNNHSEKWEYDCDAPAGCGMVYMTTKTPLDPQSWQMKGECFVNPGVSGFDYSNNHTHMHKFGGKWYMFYHTLSLKRGMGISGSYRSLAVDTINVDEETATIEKSGGTKKGVKSINYVNPFEVNSASELNNTADISYDTSDMSNPIISSKNEGSWFSVKDVEFTHSNEPTEDIPKEFSKTAVDSIKYNITVTNVDKNTTVSMYPADSSGNDCTGSAEITGTGKYEIVCDLKGAEGLMNMGYFKVDNDAQITFVIDSITVNEKYTIDLSAELTNTREWADGLRNIWNGFSDSDKVYYSDEAEFRYIKSDNAIELFTAESTGSGTGSEVSFVEESVSFLANVKGTGRIEVRMDSPKGDILTSIDFDSPNSFSTVRNTEVSAIGGIHNLYFVFSDKNIYIDSWIFAKEDLSEILMGDVNADGKVNAADLVTMQKFLLGNGNLENQKSADICGDGRIDAFDLVMLRKLLIK